MPRPMAASGVVVDHAQNRHGDFGAVGGGLHQADVFEAEAHLESGGLVALVGDERAVGFVHRRGEERVGEQVDEFVRLDAVLASEGDGFSERLDDGADEEVAGELDDVGHFGLGADDESALADGVEDGLAALEVGGSTGGSDDEFGSGGGLGASEDRRGDVALAALLMFGCELLRKRDADGAHGNVNGTLREIGGDAA